MKKIIGGIWLILFFVIQGCAQTRGGIYLPWFNSLTNLHSLSSDTIPVLLNGYNYRIVSIDNNSNSSITINKFKISGESSKIEIYSLPVINNYNKDKILDLLVNFGVGSAVNIQNGSRMYFLLKIQGDKPGYENINITFSGEQQIFKFSFVIKTSKIRFSRPLNFNVWSYFNYPLVKGISNKVSKDLVNHGVDVLVIPPGVLPSITSAVADKDISKLREYLRPLNKNNFKYYLISMNYKILPPGLLFSSRWNKNFRIWVNTIKSLFKFEGIDLSKVYFYPYDEPNVVQAKQLKEIVDYCNENHLNISFYATIGNVKTLFLSKYIDIIQLYNNPQILNAKIDKKKDGQIWYYDILSPSKNVAPKRLIEMGWKAFLYDFNGIGFWNYADNTRAFNNKSGNYLTGTWEQNAGEPSRDYSIVYRKESTLYSSIRWEAAIMAQNDYLFLKLYADKFGEQAATELVKRLLSNNISLIDWENIKISII